MIAETVDLLAGLYKTFLSAKQGRLANKIHPEQTTYKSSPYAANTLGMYQQLYNGRMAGATQLENNIYANQANAVANVNRNATNSAQALAAAAGVHGQTNQSLNQLGVQEAQNQYGLASGVAGANAGMTNEGDKVYADQLRKYHEDVAAKSALRSSQINNMYSAFDNFGRVGAGIDSMITSAAGAAMGMPIPMPKPAMGQGLAPAGGNAPYTGGIPLPQQGSMGAPYFNPVTGQWQFK